jgi:hypothetical protein
MYWSSAACKDRTKKFTRWRSADNHRSFDRDCWSLVVLLVLTEYFPFLQGPTLVGNTCAVSKPKRSSRTDQEHSSVQLDPRSPFQILERSAFDNVAEVPDERVLVESSFDQGVQGELYISSAAG